MLTRHAIFVVLLLLCTLAPYSLAGAIVGWGWNVNGQIPDSNDTDFVDIAAGSGHTLALKSDGSIRAWGKNGNGQTDVPEGNDFLAVAAADSHSVALKIGWDSYSVGLGSVWRM